MERMEQGGALYRLGLELGGLGVVSIGYGGGELAQALARSAGCGVALAGGEARFHDGSCAACGVWLGKYYGIPVSLFVRQLGVKARVHVYDRQGRTMTSGRITAASAAPCTGQWEQLVGADSGWASARVRGQRRGGAAAVEGPQALVLALERMGYAVVDRPAWGVPLFRTDREGFSLEVELNGRVFRPPGEDALAAAANFTESGRVMPAFGSGSPQVL